MPSRPGSPGTAAALIVGAAVQTPLGKGVVRDVRNHGRVLVEVHGRALVFEASGIRPLNEEAKGKRGRNTGSPLAAAEAAVPSARQLRAPGPSAGPGRIREVDLHGLTVDEAMARIDTLLDTCMRDDIAQLRVIHGRSGGRLKAALHRRLGGIPSVRAFALDASNPGVTNVFL